MKKNKDEANAVKEPVENTEATETAEAKESPAEPTAEELLERELQASKDQYLRLMAEYDNFRKRTSKEKEASFNDAKASAYAELIPVIDNFERAFAAEDANPEDFKKGIEMTRDQLLAVFEKAGVEAFGEPGEPFDPNMHNAVMHVEDETLEENVLTDVFQKGYKMGDRILRHAMVKVAN